MALVFVLLLVLVEIVVMTDVAELVELARVDNSVTVLVHANVLQTVPEEIVEMTVVVVFVVHVRVPIPYVRMVSVLVLPTVLVVFVVLMVALVPVEDAAAMKLVPMVVSVFLPVETVSVIIQKRIL